MKLEWKLKIYKENLNPNKYEFTAVDGGRQKHMRR